MSVEEHIVDLLPAYALDCLDEDEVVLVAEHVAVCADCQAELLTYQSTVAQIALAGGSDIVPSPALKSRLMDRVQPPPPASSAQPQPSWRQSLAMFLRHTSPAWGIASLILLVALGLGNLWLWQRVNQLEAPPAPVGAMRTLTLSGTEAAPEATGLFVISLDGHHGTVVVDRLPTLDGSQQYQLWLVKDGQRDSGGVFSVSEEGYGSVWVDSPKPLANYSAFGITIEPAGGSSGPTGVRVLGGSF